MKAFTVVAAVALPVLGIGAVALATGAEPREAGLSAASVYALYLSPSGNDANSGESRAKPLKTLAGAQAALKRKNLGSVDAQVRVMKGVYAAKQLLWELLHSRWEARLSARQGGGASGFPRGRGGILAQGRAVRPGWRGY